MSLEDMIKGRIHGVLKVIKQIAQILRNYKYSLAIIIIFLILLHQLYGSQGQFWIIISIFFWAFLVMIIGLIIFYIGYFNDFYKYKKGRRSDDFLNSSKSFWRIIAGLVVVIVAGAGFFPFMQTIPDFKASINDEYLHGIVDKITEGKTTDMEKIEALLGWFDRNSNNMHNSWIMVHEEKLFWELPANILIFKDPWFICIRCYKKTDPRWILTSRCGACDEYSKLFMVMADALGFPVKQLHAPGEDHLWNEVRIDGNWIPVDPTSVSLPDSDGFEDYGFMESKEGNVSYVYARFPHNDTIEDRTSKYTLLTNVTIYAVDKNNNSLSDITITIISHNLGRAPYQEISIPGRSNPKTNESGLATFQIGGGNYTFKANNDKYIGELKHVRFSDKDLSHDFRITLKKKDG